MRRVSTPNIVMIGSWLVHGVQSTGANNVRARVCHGRGVVLNTRALILTMTGWPFNSGSTMSENSHRG